jgi:hypothetical protein
MEKVLFLAIKDMRVLLSDKGNIFWVFPFFSHCFLEQSIPAPARGLPV